MEHSGAKKDIRFRKCRECGSTELLSALHFLRLSSYNAISRLKCIMQMHAYQYSQLDLGCSVQRFSCGCKVKYKTCACMSAVCGCCVLSAVRSLRHSETVALVKYAQP